MNGTSLRAAWAAPFASNLVALKSLPRPVWVLCGGAFINKFGTFVIPFLAIYMARLGFSAGETALVLTAYGAGHFVAAWVGGQMADGIGRRKTIAISMGSSAVIMLLLSQVETLWALAVVTLALGIASDLYRPAAGALLVDVTTPGQRVMAFAAHRLAFNAGWAFGPATAGLLADRSYMLLFVGDAVTSAGFGLVAWFLLPVGVRISSATAGWRPALRCLGADRRLIRLLLASFAVGLVFMQMSSTFGLHVIGLGYSPAVYGLLISLNGLLVVFFELPVAAAASAFGRRNTMAVGYALVGVGFGLNAWMGGLNWLVAAILIFTVGEMISVPVTMAYLADLAPAEMRGRYMGAFGLTWSAALVIGPATGMMLYGWNPAAIWIACGMCGLAAAGVMWGSESSGMA